MTPAISSQPLLEISHVCRHFSAGEIKVSALEDISLSIWSGEFVAIMGPSGSGKSTLMNVIGCLDRHTDGNYKVRGNDVATLSSDQLAELRRDTFGFIFQRYNLLSTSSAEENVEIPAIYAGKNKSKRSQRAMELLTQLGLAGKEFNRPAELSGGQQQRVAIARALMNDPPIILADEPTGALDSKSGEEVMQLLLNLHAQGRTIILITHDEKVASFAKRRIKIYDGKLVEDSHPDQTAPEIKASSIDRGTVFPEFGESAKMAWRSLRANTFRTVLTLLGIIIGVAAVVTMSAVGDGSKKRVIEQISTMGTNLISIRPGAPGLRGGGDIITMTPADADAVLSLPNIEAVVPERSGRYTLRVGNIDYLSTVTGVNASMPLVREWPLDAGSFFSQSDFTSYSPVIVLGKTVEKNLFPDGRDPIGKYVLVRNIPFEVIGTLTAKGAGFGGDQDDNAFVPLSTGLIRLFGKAYINGITAKAIDLGQIQETEATITALIKEKHHTEDFSIRDMSSLIDMATETQDTLTVLLGVVAAISLLVGGIGVMNIMLVSVTERTREIGIRMATGARASDILLQFNTEAAVVCTVGGGIGLIMGFLTGGIIRLFGVPVSFSIAPPIIAFACAFMTSVVFGYLPARKAAMMDPVVALAAE